MTPKKSKLILFLFLSAALCHTGITAPTNHPAYVGIIGGYGSTTWQGLVPSKENQNDALKMSTPIDVKEGGAAWGALIGYEFSPHFAVELNYIHYPDAVVYFDEFSLFSFNHEDQTNFKTKTDSISLMGKIMLLIPNSNLRIYSSTGVANLYREDLIVDDSRISPTFGVGMNYNFNEHLMGELAGNYTAGFGESLLSPEDSYFPFLYSITARLAYRF